MNIYLICHLYLTVCSTSIMANGDEKNIFRENVDNNNDDNDRLTDFDK